MDFDRMKKLAIIICLVLTVKCYNSINDMLGNLSETAIPICVANDSLAANPDGRGWKNAYKTINEAVDAAKPGAEIWVKAGSYDIEDASQIMISKSVSIYGGFNGTESSRNQRNSNVYITIIKITDTNPVYIQDFSQGAIVIDGFSFLGSGTDSMGLYLSNSKNVTLINCKFTSFNSWAISISTNSIMYVSNCSFDSNSCNQGGAIHMLNSSSLTITNNSSFTNNTGNTYGGAIFSQGSLLVISDTIFNGNTVTGSGGAISASFSSLNISNSTFIKNTSTTKGGAIFYDGDGASTLNISNSYFGLGSDNTSGNSAAGASTGDGGGAVYFTGSSAGNISNSHFNYNRITGYEGGAIYCGLNVSAAVIASDFIGNETANSGTSNGGAIACRDGADINISGECLFSGNKCGSSGGAIYIRSDTASLCDARINGSTIINNTSSGTNGWGGGISVSGNSSLAINGCEITGNTSAISGGGVYTTWAASGNPVITIESTAISGNSTTSNASQYIGGGGFYVQGQSVVSITGCVIANNTSAAAGGGIFALNQSSTTNSPTVNIIRTKITGNSAGTVGYGGGIYQNYGSLNIYNSLVSENICSNSSQIHYPSTGYGTFKAINCSFVTGTGLGFFQDGTFTNCIFYGSTINSSGSVFSYIGTNLSISGTSIYTIDSTTFVNYASKDYRLSSSSNLIGNGLNSIPGYTRPTPDLDLDGNPRIVGGTVDIGAYEAQ